MPALSTGGQLRAAVNAPAVALGYAVIALLIVRVGCTPPFLDTDVYGVPVTFFLLLALTVTALILILFAALHAWRTLRVLQRRRRGGDFSTRQKVGVAGVLLAIAAFAAVAWLGLVLLGMPCA